MVDSLSVNIPDEYDRVLMLLPPGMYLLHARPDHSYSWVAIEPAAVLEAPIEVIWERTLQPAVTELQARERLNGRGGEG